MNITKEAIVDALSKVRYPGSGKNLIEAGMVENICIEGKQVSFSLRFAKAKDPFIKSVVKASETAILTYVDKDVDIRDHISIVLPEEAVAPSERPLLPGVKNIVAVFSGKGGVGKSTVTANLAVALAREGYKVGLLDADVFGPSMPRMFDAEDARPTLDVVDGRELISPIEVHGVKLLSMGFFVDKHSPVLWRGTMASNALRQLISDGNWGELDYFLIDMPPGTSDIHLTMVQTIALTGAVVVTTPQQIALIDAIKGIGMFLEDKINVPVLGLIENMAWFTPAELPENKYYIFGRDGGKKLAEELGIPLLAQIPLVQSICEGCDNGEPSAIQEDSLSGIYFRQLAHSLVERVAYRNEHLSPTEKVSMNS
ncbi:sodium:proton antiporter [Porphyromonas crevioricanis]|uniref:Iron-sulfur cluster carrier protein n=2 Tax=Porphyromonas crevioricanis TaxID=393921 RepID=A0A0A2FFN5_9PORP|nr:Mrp/NBP35 family ATP-binding protein [Porphyromonas crevioricanis]KGN88902.1 sodium:proton antiporter [Porphyromonas crevioricanis]KGN95824.1 sodium:proton antiporter [Porphyromonas crevioricanis]SJZ74345.1 ATP-binding protein involved in chromosome partitioning [Porphyromonas crevioricanis]SQH73454.1 Cell division inhibitor MinD [Porphyromonas crevioricanis]GAD04921.1 septum site-determining protein MinD [Porphyromonas crevioricanis JCM 15906]